MKKTLFIFGFIASVALLAGCNHSSKTQSEASSLPKSQGINAGQYKPDILMEPHHLDTLLTEMVTYIGKRPKMATWERRFDPEFRGYYVNLSKDFKWVYLKETGQQEGNFAYYLLRPASALEGNIRGVGGLMQLDENFSIIQFEEVFNTPILPEADLIARGYVLFEQLLNHGNIEAFEGNQDYIEWPDGRLYYDKTQHEWRYVD